MIMNVFKNGNVNIKKDFVDGEYRNMEEFILAICYENGSDFTLGEEAMEFAPQRMTLYNYHTGLSTTCMRMTESSLKEEK